MSDHIIDDENLKKFLQDNAPTAAAPKAELVDRILEAAKSDAHTSALFGSVLSLPGFLIGCGLFLALFFSAVFVLWSVDPRQQDLVPLEEFAEWSWDGALGDFESESDDIIIELME